MNTKHNLVKNIERRRNNILNVKCESYHTSLCQFTNWIHEQPVLLSIIDVLKHKCTDTSEQLTMFLKQSDRFLFPTDETKMIALSYSIIKHCSDQKDTKTEWQIMLSQYFNCTSFNDGISSFNRLFLIPFLDYLIENIESHNSILALLLKYKKRCEWFERDYLCDKWNSETTIGEKLLAYDLYKYLNDNDISFTIEPSSASGEIDMIAEQVGEKRLLVDAKVYNADPNYGKGRANIKKAVNQLHSYLNDYNEDTRYLVIYKTGEKGLSFELEEMHSVPFLRYCNKNICFLLIDIYPYNKSASQRKRTDYEVIDFAYLTDKIKIE